MKKVIEVRPLSGYQIWLSMPELSLSSSVETMPIEAACKPTEYRDAGVILLAVVVQALAITVSSDDHCVSFIKGEAFLETSACTGPPTKRWSRRKKNARLIVKPLAPIGAERGDC